MMTDDVKSLATTEYLIIWYVLRVLYLEVQTNIKIYHIQRLAFNSPSKSALIPSFNFVQFIFDLCYRVLYHGDSFDQLLRDEGCPVTT